MTPFCTKACLRIEIRSSCELLERLIESETPGGQPVTRWDCLAHDVFVLLNRTHEVWIRGRLGCGVDEILELVLSGFEVVKRVLEAGDFLNGQFYGRFLLRGGPRCVGGCVTLGYRADVEVHGLSPCEGLRVLKLYFCRHFSFAVSSAGKWGCGCLAKALEPNKLSSFLGNYPLSTDRFTGRHKFRDGPIRPFTLSLFDFTMSPNLPNFLFDVLRNPAVAIGLPLTLGFLSGSGTKNVIRGVWYRVRTPNFNRYPPQLAKPHTESFIPSWKAPAGRIPNHLDRVVHSDGPRLLPRHQPPR